MNTISESISEIIRSIIVQNDGAKSDVTITNKLSLYERDDGLGLDSMDVAELSALLEQRFGYDPYSEGLFVQTVGELVDYYLEKQK